MEVLAGAIRLVKEVKDIQIKKEEGKLPLFAHDMIFYRENLKESIKISVAFLYSNNEQSEKVMRETFPFTIASI